MSNSEPLLQVSELQQSFGGLQAVRSATFSVHAGSITGLIGPNGAGKSTTFDMIAGRARPDSGFVRFDGHYVTGQGSDRIANRGLVRTFQIPRVFGRLTVWENLLFAGRDQPGEGFWRGLAQGRRLTTRAAAVEEKAGRILELLTIEGMANSRADSLSGGQRKLLELGRALMADPKMVLLDEPTAGVAPALTGQIVELIRSMAHSGVTVLIVEHDIDLIMQLVDHLVVMHLGEVLTSGEPGRVREDPRVLESYLGVVHA